MRILNFKDNSKEHAQKGQRKCSSKVVCTECGKMNSDHFRKHNTIKRNGCGKSKPTVDSLQTTLRFQKV